MSISPFWPANSLVTKHLLSSIPQIHRFYPSWYKKKVNSVPRYWGNRYTTRGEHKRKQPKPATSLTQPPDHHQPADNPNPNLSKLEIKPDPRQDGMQLGTATLALTRARWTFLGLGSHAKTTTRCFGQLDTANCSKCPVSIVTYLSWRWPGDGCFLVFSFRLAWWEEFSGRFPRFSRVGKVPW